MSPAPKRKKMTATEIAEGLINALNGLRADVAALRLDVDKLESIAVSTSQARRDEVNECRAQLLAIFRDAQYGRSSTLPVTHVPTTGEAWVRLTDLRDFCDRSIKGTGK